MNHDQPPFTVLQLWKSDYHGAGGGAIAMHRLHGGLRRAGIDSRILCSRKTTDLSSVATFAPHRLVRSLEARLQRVTLKLGLHDIHRVGSFGLRQHPVYRTADVVHVHGTHGFLNYLALPWLTRNKPVLLTLHDKWPYTGHCGFSCDCPRWRTGCGKCPYPENHPAIEKDSTHLEWMLKAWIYRFSQLTIVTLNTFSTREVTQSILARFPVHQIPNGIDTAVYRPLDREACRSGFGIPFSKRVLMFSALNLAAPNKGGDLLLAALRSLPKALKKEMLLLTMGNGGDAVGRASGIEWLDLGYLSDEHLKASAYNAADGFVLPSRAEMLPLVLQESLACGTPLIAFDVGGVADVVRPGITGYLARPGDPRDLARGMVLILENEALCREMGAKGRELALKEFSLDLQVARHMDLYRQVCRRKAA